MQRNHFSLLTLSFPLICALAPLAANSAPSNDAIEQARLLSSAFESVATEITPSVVTISSIAKPKPGKAAAPNDQFIERFREFFGDELPFQVPPEGGMQQGLGSGVIVDNNGHILTNAHVIDKADEVTVRTADERTFKAEVIGTDPRSDLAVIKVKAKNLIPAQLGNSDDLKIGEWVVAAGNPFGLSNTITSGIVSAKGRSLMGGGQYEDFIQTDAAINPGNSGGALVNLRGEVVGINTAIFSRSGGYMGIGFAIPINMAKNVMASLINDGKVTRGWLGIGIQNLTDELSQSFSYEGTEGALVGHIDRKGPAAKSGLSQGDIIVALNNAPIKNINQLRNQIASTKPGEKIKLTVLHDSKKREVEVTVGELPATLNETPHVEQAANDIGVTVETLTPEMANRLGSDKDHGIVVRNVRPGSVADRAGLGPRDIIISVNGKKIESVHEFNDLINKADSRKGIRLVVETQGMERFVFLKSNE
jgi:serine protease Do